MKAARPKVPPYTAREALLLIGRLVNALADSLPADLPSGLPGVKGVKPRPRRGARRAA